MKNFISYKFLTSKKSFQKKINPSPSLLAGTKNLQAAIPNKRFFMDGITIIIILCSYYQNKSSNIIVSHRQTLTEYCKS